MVGSPPAMSVLRPPRMSPLAGLALGLSALFTGHVAAAPTAAQDGPPFSVEDRFGRPLLERGLQLLDWEGAIANPQVEFVVRPGAEIPANRYPLRVRVQSSSPRLLFPRFSRLTAESSSKEVTLERPGDVARLSITVFPDADGEDEQHELTLLVEDAAEQPWTRTLAVRVRDRDRARDPGLQILLDDRHDATGLMADAPRRAAIDAAAAELGDLLKRQGFDEVAAGAETGWIWGAEGFDTGGEVANAEAYRGFLVFAQGITHEGRYSGSCASDRNPDAVQTRQGQPVGLRRSGTIAIETSGNWNGRGWHVDEGDPSGWLRSRNLEADPHDLLSVARHELLHALVYHGAHPAYVAKLQDGRFVDDDLRAYLGHDPEVDANQHLIATVDPVSGFGAFGNEYGTRYPWRRWLPTKVDLLVLRAVGYRLRAHASLVPLALEPHAEAEGVLIAPAAALPFEAAADAEPEDAAAAPNGAAPREAQVVRQDLPDTVVTIHAGRSVTFDLGPRGGVPPYHLQTQEGAWPDGLALDTWTGRVHGALDVLGEQRLIVSIDDQELGTGPVRTTLLLRVIEPPTPEPTAEETGPGGLGSAEAGAADGEAAGTTPPEPGSKEPDPGKPEADGVGATPGADGNADGAAAADPATPPAGVDVPVSGSDGAPEDGAPEDGPPDPETPVPDPAEREPAPADGAELAPGAAAEDTLPASDPGVQSPSDEAAPEPPQQLFPHSVLWKPEMDGEAALDPYLAPLLYLEADAEDPLARALLVTASGEGAGSATPTLYFADETVVVRDASRRQLTFLWFVASRAGDPPRANALRVTCGEDGMPWVYELLPTEAGAPAYVSKGAEARATAAFGAPEVDAYALGGGATPGTQLHLRGVFQNGPVPMGPYVYASRADAQLLDLHCRCAPTRGGEILEMGTYGLRPLASLLGERPDLAERLAAFGPPDRVALELRLPDGL